jgi:hypothetical protein
MTMTRFVLGALASSRLLSEMADRQQWRQCPPLLAARFGARRSLHEKRIVTLALSERSEQPATWRVHDKQQRTI